MSSRVNIFTNDVDKLRAEDPTTTDDDNNIIIERRVSTGRIIFIFYIIFSFSLVHILPFILAPLPVLRQQ